MRSWLWFLVFVILLAACSGAEQRPPQGHGGSTAGPTSAAGGASSGSQSTGIGASGGGGASPSTGGAAPATGGAAPDAGSDAAPDAGTEPPTPVDPIDPTVTTTIASASSFLISGPNPTQTGVAPGTIEPARAAIVRGHVATADSTPFGGAVAQAAAADPGAGAGAGAADRAGMVVDGGRIPEPTAPSAIRASRLAR